MYQNQSNFRPYQIIKSKNILIFERRTKIEIKQQKKKNRKKNGWEEFT